MKILENSKLETIEGGNCFALGFGFVAVTLAFGLIGLGIYYYVNQIAIDACA